MSFSQLFTNVLDRLKTIQSLSPISNPRPSNNYQKTPSNVNQRFKTINIWNDQIDNEIKGLENYIIKCPACLIEFIPEEPKLILGGVTQYMDAKMYFHIYSDQIGSSNPQGDFMDMNLEIFDLRDIVKSKFLGFHTSFSSAMMSRFDGLDYKHKTLTAYILGFTFCFNDLKGSIYDSESDRYLQQLEVNATFDITPIHNWVSGNSYTAFSNVVHIHINQGIEYFYFLCIVSNSDTSFILSKWQPLLHWISLKQYLVGDYIFNNGFVYRSLNSNSDESFDINNWELITKM